GVVSAANSLVGSSPGDYVGGSPNGYIRGITVLSNGNYVVESPNWNGSLGAATWGSGSEGVAGVVSAADSLIGSNPGDYVGGSPDGNSGGITALSNGSYVVGSWHWNGSRGAATWGSGMTGVVGVISSTNSLVGSNPGDDVGSDPRGVAVLSNGNYVVFSPDW